MSHGSHERRAHNTVPFYREEGTEAEGGFGASDSDRPTARDPRAFLFDDEPDTAVHSGTLISRDAEALARLLDAPPSPMSAEPTITESACVDSRRDVATPCSFRVPAPPSVLVASLTILNGARAGEVFVLDRDSVVIGRSCCCDIAIDDDAVSRRHARVTRDGAGEYHVEDLRSRNGTFVGLQRVTRSRIYAADRLYIGPDAALRFGVAAEDEVRLQRSLFTSSTFDSLTGALNRESLYAGLDAQVSLASSAGTELHLILIDIDRFKRVNDKHGHQVGDCVLSGVAACIRLFLGPEDLFGRLGGDEFVVVVPGRPRQEARNLAEFIRARIATWRMTLGADARSVTASVGVAALSEVAAARGSALIERADTRMYAAKAAGRNCVRAS